MEGEKYGDHTNIQLSATIRSSQVHTTPLVKTIFCLLLHGNKEQDKKQWKLTVLLSTPSEMPSSDGLILPTISEGTPRYGETAEIRMS